MTTKIRISLNIGLICLKVRVEYLKITLIILAAYLWIVIWHTFVTLHSILLLLNIYFDYNVSALLLHIVSCLNIYLTNIDKKNNFPCFNYTTLKDYWNKLVPSFLKLNEKPRDTSSNKPYLKSFHSLKEVPSEISSVLLLKHSCC